MKQFVKGAILSILLSLVAHNSFAAEPIGKVILAKGASIVIRDNQEITLKRKDNLYQKDSLITSKGSRLLIKFIDGTSLSLAENTEFNLTRYRFNSQKSDVSFKLLKGAFRSVTGAIGQQEEPKFEVHTPIATIGIRGTDFWGGFIFSDALDVTMIKGKGVYVRNAQGTVELKKPTDGTTVSAGQAPTEVKQWPKEKLQTAAAATAVE